MMPAPSITFAKLRQFLLSRGFTEFVKPKSIHGFVHSDSNTEIFLPIYRFKQVVAPHHLALVRIHLDAKGLLDAAEFARAVAGPPAERSASR
jgi:hypothetical protein